LDKSKPFFKTVIAIALAVTLPGAALRANEPSPADCRELFKELYVSLAAPIRGRLAFHNDPFLFESSSEYAYIWDELKKEFPSLAEVIHARDEIIKGNRKFTTEFEEKMIRSIEAVSSHGQRSVRQDQAVLMTIDEIRTLKQYSHSVDDATKEAKEVAEKTAEKAKKEEPKPKQPQEEEEPKFPDPADAYKASIKDFPDSDEGGGAPKKVSIARVNVQNVVYFKTGTYGLVDGKTGVWNATTVTKAQTASLPKRITEYKSLHVKPFDKKGQRLPVPIPEGFVPVEKVEGASKVWQEPNGNYYFSTNLDEFQISLVPQKLAARPLNPFELSAYSQKSAVSLSEWPEIIQLMVRQIRSMEQSGQIVKSERNFQIAELMKETIKRQFLYAMDKVEAVGAPAMAHNGAFQCDGAATILSTILRDEFNIPTRACSGFQGASNGVRGESHVVLPGIGHAWVEVADEHGVWKTFDATPTKKTRPEKKPPGGGEKEEFKNNTKDDEPEDSDPESGDAGEGAGKESDQKAKEKTLKEIVDEFTKDRDAKAKAESEKGKPGGKPGEAGKPGQAAGKSGEEGKPGEGKGEPGEGGKPGKGKGEGQNKERESKG